MSFIKDDPIGTPWWVTSSGLAAWSSDYTRSRSGLAYNSPNSLIGKRDYQKYRLVTDDPLTVSGTPGTILI